MSMNESAPIETAKQDRLAEISREQYSDYVNRFRPIEDKLITSIDNPELMQEGLSSVSKNAGTASDVMKESNAMRTGRYGGMSAEQRKAAEDKIDLSLSAAEVGGRNAVRSNIIDRDITNLTSLVDAGSGLRGLANNSFASAAQMEANRNATNSGIAASNTAGRWGLAGTAAGVGILAA